jgi:hypothetical protein
MLHIVGCNLPADVAKFLLMLRTTASRLTHLCAEVGWQRGAVRRHEEQAEGGRPMAKTMSMRPTATHDGNEAAGWCGERVRVRGVRMLTHARRAALDKVVLRRRLNAQSQPAALCESNANA